MKSNAISQKIAESASWVELWGSEESDMTEQLIWSELYPENCLLVVGIPSTHTHTHTHTHTDTHTHMHTQTHTYTYTRTHIVVGEQNTYLNIIMDVSESRQWLRRAAHITKKIKQAIIVFLLMEAHKHHLWTSFVKFLDHESD